jgi:hypothetical protein
MKSDLFLRVLVMAVVLGVGLMGCDLETDKSSGGTVLISDLRVRDTTIKSLYISNLSRQGSARVASGGEIQTISYINESGQNAPFSFTTPSGKNIVLNTGEIQQLDSKRLLVDFGSYYEITINDNDGSYSIGDETQKNGRALIDIGTGKVYDFTAWGIEIIADDTVYANGRDHTIL